MKTLNFLKLPLVLVLLLLPSASFAQNVAYPPHTVPSKPKARVPRITIKHRERHASSRIAIPYLKGIVIVSSVKDFKPKGVSFKGVSISGLPILNTPSFINYIESRLNKPLTFNGIQGITRNIDNIYKSHGLPFMDAIVPPQNVSRGTLQVVVVQYKVSRITVSGNKWFSDNYILSFSGIAKGEALSEASLASGMDWLNSNPFIHADAILSPGVNPGDMDVKLLTKDVMPLRIFAGYDNQGIPSLGINEWDLGFNYGNLFGSGQMLSYEYAQSFSTRYRAQSLSYEIPFSWKGRVELLGSYATASPHMDSHFNELGRNSQVSLYYKQGLPYYIHNGFVIKQTVGLGYDFKTTNNNLVFGGVQVFQGVAQIDQFPVFYSFFEKDPYGMISLANRFVLSPGDFNADNSDASFNSIYPDTRSKYEYDNLNLSRLEYLPFGFSFYSSADFQAASRNLIYTEQLAAGGLYTVQGYLTDTATGSRGVILREELNLPPVNIAPVFQGTVPAYRNAPLPVSLGLFWTYADLSSVNNVSASTGLPDTSVLESVGPELKMDIKGYLSLDFALGWRLRHLPYGSYGKGLFEDVVVTLSI